MSFAVDSYKEWYNVVDTSTIPPNKPTMKLKQLLLTAFATIILAVSAIATPPTQLQMDVVMNATKTHLVTTLKDPESYKSSGWIFWRMTNRDGVEKINCYHSYAAKNSMGGYVTGEILTSMIANKATKPTYLTKDELKDMPGAWNMVVGDMQRQFSVMDANDVVMITPKRKLGDEEIK